MRNGPQEVLNRTRIAEATPQVRSRPRHVVDLSADISAHDVPIALNLSERQVEVVDANQHHALVVRAIHQNLVVNHRSGDSRGRPVEEDLTPMTSWSPQSGDSEGAGEHIEVDVMHGSEST